MYELMQVSGNCYYISSPTNIGVVKVSADHVVVIDSGSDKNAGKKVKRVLDQNGWILDAVYNTHYHADHTGGNRYLQTNTGCRVYAPDIEDMFTRHPVLEPAFLYAGMPPKELRHKFLMAKESDAETLTEDVLPDGFRIIPLPGHSFNMTGYMTPDGVAYIADCLSSRATLEKYQVSFLIDPQEYIETLERVMDLDAEYFVPCHAEPCGKEELRELAQANIDKTYEIAEKIIEITEEPKAFDEVLSEIFMTYGLEMTFEQHALLGTTVRSYLTWLESEGKVEPLISENMLKWVRA